MKRVLYSLCAVFFLAPYASSQVFNPLTGPVNSGLCPTNGVPVTVSNYPSSPFDIPVFTQPYTQPPTLPPSATTCDSQDSSRCIDAFDITMKTTQVTLAPGLPLTNFMGYNGITPGPTLSIQRGRQSVVRFKNEVTGYFVATKPPGSSGTREPYKNPCPGSRPFTIHHHGQASISAFDGWAEDEMCFGEYKDYVYPNADVGTYWYHDHAADITSENVYYGLAGFSFVRAFSGSCPEPFLLNTIPQKLMILQDKVLDKNAQLYFDRRPGGPHFDNLYGDINLVNGVPFPYDSIDPRWHLFRFLGASNSRPWNIQIKDSNGRFVHQDICWVVAPALGIRGAPVKMQLSGLPIGVAERYSVACDFSTKANQTLYVINGRPDFFIDVPYFCHSHLLVKLIVSDKVGNYAKVDFQEDRRTSEPTIFTQANLRAARSTAANGKPQRQFQFGRSGGNWAINNQGWRAPNDQFHLADQGKDVGVNTWEVWNLVGGGGWFHPIHIHLVKFFVLQRNGKPAEDFEFDPSLKSGKDVVFWRPGNKIDVAARFGPFKGIYMFHCHNTVHEDGEMMRAFQVLRALAGRNAVTAFSSASRLEPFSPFNPNNTIPISISPQALPTAPALTSQYLQTVIDRRYYAIHYPRPTEAVVADPSVNPWIVPREGDCTAE